MVKEDFDRAFLNYRFVITLKSYGAVSPLNHNSCNVILRRMAVEHVMIVSSGLRLHTEHWNLYLHRTASDRYGVIRVVRHGYLLLFA